VDKPLLQADAFHPIAGRKGQGKGTLLASIAARVTRGELGERRNVVWIGSEDSAAIDIRPRIVAAGGDDTRVLVVKSGWIQLPRDIEEIRRAMEEIGEVGMLVIDPVGNHITGKNSSGDTDIRDAIAPLNDLADRHGCILVGIRHLTEKEATGGAISAILGASAWVQVPRAVIVVARDDVDAGISHIQCIAGNRLPPETPGRSFRIEGVLLPGLENEVTRAVWIGDSTKDIETLIGNGANADRIPAARVQELILAELASGEKSRKYLDAAAKDELGANSDSVYKSGLQPLRNDDRIKARKDGTTGPWLWRLSDEEAAC
jgi:AAA domain-containing protein